MSKMTAKEPVPKVVVDEKGTVVPLKAAMEPIYIKLSKFGRTPKYLKRFLEEREKEYQMKKDASRRLAQPLCKYITRDEREKLLNVNMLMNLEYLIKRDLFRRGSNKTGKNFKKFTKDYLF